VPVARKVAADSDSPRPVWGQTSSGRSAGHCILPTARITSVIWLALIWTLCQRQFDCKRLDECADRVCSLLASTLARSYSKGNAVAAPPISRMSRFFCCGQGGITVSDSGALGGGSLPPLVFAGSGGADDAQIVPTSVMVVVRIRPLVQRETALKSSVVVQRASATSVTMAEDTTGASKGTVQARSFTFDYVLGSDASQQQVYQNTGRVILDKVLQGFNGCVFAYGQTGSGKTWTMEGGGGAGAGGAAAAAAAASRALPESAGVMPRM
jgi:hypothetical protein